MNYIYHYSARYECRGTTIFADGIIKSEVKLNAEPGVYRAAKQCIANENNFDFEKMALTSLTLLHTECK